MYWRQQLKLIQQNPKLKQLAVLIGEWSTQGTHSMLPGRTVHDRTTFEWLEFGAFLLARIHVDESEIPDGVAIFGTDDAQDNAGSMPYFDVRGVSREYRWTIANNVWRWSRNDPHFRQRM